MDDSGAGAARLQRRTPDRVLSTLARYRRGGRRVRTVRRGVAVALLVTAGLLASLDPPAGAGGTAVLVARRAVPAGATLTGADLGTATVAAPPDGALTAAPQALEQVTTGRIRRGEILTDVRILGHATPDAGPGRVAVPIHVRDPAVADLLHPGMHVAVVTVDDRTGAQQPRTLADDAVVLSVPAAGGGSIGPAPDDRIVLLAVPTGQADAVATAGLTGPVALRFR